jgi:siderophore synthetase component
MTLDLAPAPHAHLTSERWAQASRLLVAKALGEFTHERLLHPRALGDGRYAWDSDDGTVTYTAAARRFALDHWRVDPATIERSDGHAPDALDLVLHLAVALGLRGEQLGIYLEEVTSTASALAYKLEHALPVDDLLDAGFQAIEAGMTEGHPCFVANSGRIGWSAEDYTRYAPEAGQPVRLLWVAAHRDHAQTSSQYADVVADAPAAPDDHVLIPVHPWQWSSRLAVTFAADVAAGRLVLVGESEHEYLPQQSIRTFFDVTDPARDYVKTALSVVNMGFVRGLSAQYMKGTPAINDWVAGLFASDPVLRRTEILRERAAVGYTPPQYRGGIHAKMLAALWRESPVPRLRDGERLATMASLLHVDPDGRSLAATLIERSGLTARAWLDAYLDAYLTPLLRCYFEHGLVFMPHGENVILALDEWVPRRVFLKDIGEEVVVMDPRTPLPPEVERIRAEVPDELRRLSLLTDVVDCFLRFLGPILVEAGAIDEDGFWDAVRDCITRYDDPRTAELLEPRFALSCLNRLQLANSRQMVDLTDPAGSLQLLGTLPNPIAGIPPGA